MKLIEKIFFFFFYFKNLFALSKLNAFVRIFRYIYKIYFVFNLLSFFLKKKNLMIFINIYFYCEFICAINKQTNKFKSLLKNSVVHIIIDNIIQNIDVFLITNINSSSEITPSPSRSTSSIMS